MSYAISFFLFKLFVDKEKNELIYFGIIILLIISCFIYLEIIELKFCNLNKNLRKNISERCEKETIDGSMNCYTLYSNENDTFSLLNLNLI